MFKTPKSRAIATYKGSCIPNFKEIAAVASEENRLEYLLTMPDADTDDDNTTKP